MKYLVPLLWFWFGFWSAVNNALYILGCGLAFTPWELVWISGRWSEVNDVSTTVNPLCIPRGLVFLFFNKEMSYAVHRSLSLYILGLEDVYFHFFNMKILNCPSCLVLNEVRMCLSLTDGIQGQITQPRPVTLWMPIPQRSTVCPSTPTASSSWPQGQLTRYGYPHCNSWLNSYRVLKIP